MALFVSWAWRLIRVLVMFLALALIVVTILPSVQTTAWWIRYLDFPRLEFMILMLVVGFALIMLGLGLLGGLALLGLLGCLAYDCWVVAPFSPLVEVQQIGATACPAGNRLRLLEVNVQMTNKDAAKLVGMVQQLKPDVAWFQEVDDFWADKLAPLTAEMPNIVKKPLPNYFGVELMSRLRLVDAQVNQLMSSRNPSIFTGLELPSGQVIRLYAIHPQPPQMGQSTAERAGQLMATALAARADNVPHVIAGDLNAVPWEDIVERTQRVGRFLDPRIGRGLYITWNAKRWYLRWPLDQILPGQNFTLLSLRVLPPFGSDHMPYVAELCYDPAAARDQSPPKLHPDDLAIAHTDVERGQNAAQGGSR